MCVCVPCALYEKWRFTGHRVSSTNDICSSTSWIVVGVVGKGSPCGPFS